MASRQSYPLADDDLRIRHKHQLLLQAHSILQTEVESRKRKSAERLERKQILRDEVGFLRRRLAYLLKIQARKFEKEQELAQSQAPADEYSIDANNRFCSGIEAAALTSPSSSGLPNCTLEPENKGKEKGICLEPTLSIGKKTKKLLVNMEPPVRIEKNKNLQPNSKRVEKRKIYLQDQLVLEA